MKNGFVVFYVKNEIGYPVAMNEEQLTMINFVCEGLFESKITLIDNPIGKVENLIKKTDSPASKNQSQKKY